MAVTTAPDTVTAERIAASLLEERLIACANLLPGATSVYRWEGEVRREAEVLVLMKTRAALVAPLGERLKALHPYTVPELVALPIGAALPAYAAWVVEETAGADATGGGGPASVSPGT